MSIKSPIFPMPEPQHFSDYGFDPQMDYFQVLEEARRHKRENRSVDALHFKLQKPISKEESKKSKKRKWWRNALHFWKWKREEQQGPALARRRAIEHSSYRAVSGPIYSLECGVGTPCRTSRPTSGPLAGTLYPTQKGDFEVPYLNLRELNVESRRISTSSVPIYLVT
ncbi:hypothetical protein H6P81_003988 [Aristolochia fimbriata]|uniref:Uncharacterized protein n=1 Tax=Aristolochia fimbriata TaxID=158543 RepID=A0AAV7FE54_ARIFI|nr:hypothetical protein H6P81_003988 [Aristolochia fimbriata]